jgi:hypothetical protein
MGCLTSKEEVKIEGAGRFRRAFNREFCAYIKPATNIHTQQKNKRVEQGVSGSAPLGPSTRAGLSRDWPQSAATQCRAHARLPLPPHSRLQRSAQRRRRRWPQALL